MTKNIFEVEERFYKQCAEILKVDYIFRPYFIKKTRWNRRNPGNGRFEGFGLIRRYSKDNIHMILSYPIIVNTLFKSEDSVFLFLKEMINNERIENASTL